LDDWNTPSTQSHISSEVTVTQPQADRPRQNVFNRYDFDEQLTTLRSGTPIRAHGRDSVTLVCDASFNLMLVALAPGGRLPKYHAPGSSTVVVLDGRVALPAQSERLEPSMHNLITLPDLVPHEAETLNKSAILITITTSVTHTDAVGLQAEREAQRGFVHRTALLEPQDSHGCMKAHLCYFNA
jgi:quercetin dioxygenase-like cupin family protein